MQNKGANGVSDIAVVLTKKISQENYLDAVSEKRKAVEAAKPIERRKMLQLHLKGKESLPLSKQMFFVTQGE